MKRSINVSMVLAILAAYAMALMNPSLAQSTTATASTINSAQDQERLRGFAEEVEKIRKEWQVPGMAVVVVKGDQILYAQGHGLRDIEHQLPMTADTLLPIGSSSKSFTTAMIAALVEEGKLDWNKPIKTWLPNFKMQDSFVADRLSLLDMVTHRSGLPRHDLVWYGPSTQSMAQITEALQYLEANKGFRTEFQYNNLMFVGAGHVTEVVAGLSWQETVRNRLLLPLAMTRTNFDVRQGASDGNFSFGYQKTKQGVIKVMPFQSLNHIVSAGGINSSVKEMAAWLQLHLNQGKYQGKQILSPQSIAFLHTPQVLSDDDLTPEVVPTGYAPGWFTGVYRGHRRLEHSGVIDGFASAMVLFPDDGVGVMVLANLFLTNAHSYTARAAADRMLDLSRVDWSGRALQRSHDADHHHQHSMEAELPLDRVQGTQTSHALSAYVGTFEHPAYGVLKVSESHGKLVFEFHGVVTPLQHWHYDVFVGERAEDNPKFESQRLQFNTASNGLVQSVQLDLVSGLADIVFTRRIK